MGLSALPVMTAGAGVQTGRSARCPRARVFPSFYRARPVSFVVRTVETRRRS